MLDQAKIIDTSTHSLILEISGTVDQVSRLLLMLKPFRIIEVQRTGVVAIERGNDQTPSKPPLLN